jgi:hypothetical protein
MRRENNVSTVGVLNSNVEVFLDIYSGRENPRWTLSGTRVEELKARLEELPESDPNPIPGLGYRGFLLLSDPHGERVESAIRVFDSVISITHQDRTRHYRDINRLEEWLVSQARELGLGETLDRFRMGREPR